MQWMWAAMGATKGGARVTTTGYSKEFAGSTGSNNINDFAWYGGWSGEGTAADQKPHEVGKKTANELGLYDMSGNVWELVWDWDARYAAGTLTDPTGAASGLYRVIRGGGWLADVPITSRNNNNSENPVTWYSQVGFRFVCP
jgi:formylglycine-generating enzyme required for sulfatase activity